jgi:DNA (cytosine-5)-methyltransferase 1
MLRYAIDVYNKVEDDVPKSMLGEKLSPPPQPGDIDVIIAGFPWYLAYVSQLFPQPDFLHFSQPHSSLNRFLRANDRKSNLILNLLSWVDFLQPRFCFFENVRGFLNYNTGSVQSGKNTVEGGITMGGLKFVTRCLLAMGYFIHNSIFIMRMC